jgi:hypothetical protein
MKKGNFYYDIIVIGAGHVSGKRGQVLFLAEATKKILSP